MRGLLGDEVDVGREDRGVGREGGGRGVVGRVRLDRRGRILGVREVPEKQLQMTSRRVHDTPPPRPSAE